MESLDKTTHIDFRTHLRDLLEGRKSVRIQYFTEINEFISTTAIIKKLFDREGVEHVSLSSGEEVPLSKLVRAGDMPAPGYGKDYFACDC